MEDIKGMDDDELLNTLSWFKTKKEALEEEDKDDEAKEITAFAKNILEKIGGIFRDEEMVEKYLNNGEGNNKISQEEFIILVILKYKQQTGKGLGIKDLCDNIQRKIDVHNYNIASGKGKHLENLGRKWREKYEVTYQHPYPPNFRSLYGVRNEIADYLKPKSKPKSKGGKSKNKKRTKSKNKTRKKSR